jgi:hypothetical protein
MRLGASWLVGLAVAVSLVLAACGDDSGTPTDGPVLTEAGPETAPDAGVDLAADMLPPDGPVADGPVPDGPVPDGPVPDGPVGDGPVGDGPVGEGPVGDGPLADGPVGEGPVGDGPLPDAMQPDGPPPVPEVLYSKNTAGNKYTLYTVALDGTGDQAVSGVPADFEICNLEVAAIVGPQDVRRDLPVQSSWGGRAYLQLPDGLGRLYRIFDGTNYHLMQIKPDNTITLLTDKVDVGCATYLPIALSKDGKLAAVVLDNSTKLALVRTDGTTWSGTTPASAVLDVTPASWTMTSVRYTSLTMGAQTLLFTARDATNADFLYQVPLDGSAPAAQVTLPNVDGAAVTYINEEMAVSADGLTFAFVAGQNYSNEEVMVYQDGTTPVAKIISGGVNDYLHAGEWFMSDMDPRLAVSPTGAYVVYTTNILAGGSAECWIASTSSAAKIEISSTTNFQVMGTNKVDTFGGFYWVDDNNLLLWAGVDKTHAGLFHYVLNATSPLTHLMGATNATTAPPWEAGTLAADGAWVSPNGKFLYFVAGPSISASDITGNIVAVDLSTYAKVDITTGLDIDGHTDLIEEMEGLVGSNYVWFVAAQANATPSIEDVYVFDQNAGTAASVKQLTTHSGSADTSVYNLTVSPDGTYASYSVGASGTEILYAVPTSGASAAAAVNGSGSFVANAYAWTPDSLGVVYGGGSVLGTLDLLYTLLAGTTTTLNAAQSYLYVFNVAP